MATKKAGKVAIVYSENENSSSESKNLAHYLCGLLSASGFAQIYMLPYNASGPISDLTSNRRIIFYPPNSSKPMEVPVSARFALCLSLSFRARRWAFLAAPAGCC